MSGNAWVAEEIVQDVFMTLMREPKKFDPKRGALRSFLYGITRNHVLKHLERTPRESLHEEINDDGAGQPAGLIEAMTPAELATVRERREQVRAAVQELPVEFRETVVLCGLEELSYAEAARLLDCPVGTIRSRLNRGRALLLAKVEMLRDTPKRAREPMKAWQEKRQ
jgi:RNA polymerase sigma-70 factor (ECF subfamily)